MNGIRYLVIAIGGADDKATDEDVTSLLGLAAARLYPLVVTPLSERVSDRLTIELLRERGVL